MNNKTLDGLFRPKSIAIIGASSTPGKIGYTVLKNIIDNNYAGAVYPINPKRDEVLGIKAYPSVLDVEGDIDAAIMVVPSSF
ncbi:MAG: CoA-binding protein, partial [Anaerolineaceae bacterium]|nr:CoA-binding protein [Anaerolineaceae bacterium]